MLPLLALVATLFTVQAPPFDLRDGATLVQDQERPAARIWHVDLYTPEPQPFISTLAFKDTLNAHAGQNLQVCVRSHASKDGAVVVFIPKATVDIFKIPTTRGQHYRTRCVEFTVRDHPGWRPGRVQVANDGPIGRVDYIRNVSIREAS